VTNPYPEVLIEGFCVPDTFVTQSVSVALQQTIPVVGQKLHGPNISGKNYNAKVMYRKEWGPD
jgi:hypothetical protein